MRLISASLTLVALANAAVLDRRAAGLEVTLAPADNNAAEVIATVKNVGFDDLNLLTLGTFLDTAPIQKLVVVDEAGWCISNRPRSSKDPNETLTTPSYPRCIHWCLSQRPILFYFCRVFPAA